MFLPCCCPPLDNVWSRDVVESLLACGLLVNIASSGFLTDLGEVLPRTVTCNRIDI